MLIKFTINFKLIKYVIKEYENNIKIIDDEKNVITEHFKNYK